MPRGASAARAACPALSAGAIVPPVKAANERPHVLALIGGLAWLALSAGNASHMGARAHSSPDAPAPLAILDEESAPAPTPAAPPTHEDCPVCQTLGTFLAALAPAPEAVCEPDPRQATRGATDPVVRRGLRRDLARAPPASLIT